MRCYCVDKFQPVEEKKKTEDKDAEDKFMGTEFLVVSMATGASDPSGKLEIMRQQLSFEDWPELDHISNAINEMEK